MADEEAEKDRGPENDVNAVITELKQRLQELQDTTVTQSQDAPLQSSFSYCQDFCRTLLEYAGRWRIEEEPVPLVRVYVSALLSYAETSPYLSVECENVPLVVERLSLSFVELLLSLNELPDDLWNEFKSCVQFSHSKLQENGITQLSMLWALGQQEGVWTNPVLQGLLSGEQLQTKQIEELLFQEGHSLLEMRVKQLMKNQQLEKAALLAKSCSESASCSGKGNFKQMYLVCLCATSEQDQLMEELSKVDCRDALEMICNLESDGDEKAAFTLCSAFLTRQLLQADAYCAWELTLFWSKLLKRLEPSEKAFLDKCCQMSVLSKTVYHILFLIKVIQSEINEAGLPVCIEMCIRALRMQSEDGNTKATVCKTIACLLPNDLEVKRACQLTEFLLEPTVDSYYAVETLYNEPDQKLEEENMPVPNSLRCELLLVFKTQWPFDPEFWDWKTLKRHCLALMGEEASIVSSIDLLNDTDDGEEEEMFFDDGFLESAEKMVSGTYELTDNMDRKQKNREMKKLREKGFISARFRNWQAYMQYCVLCDKEFLGHRIIRHAQTHFSSGVYSCPICAQTFTSKDTLTPHVTSHVKQSSKDRLTAMKTNKKLANPKTAAPVIAALIAKTENEVSENGGLLGQNAGSVQNVQARFLVENSEENVCPVGTCKKSFKFYKNLIAHVKAHRDNEEAISYLEMRSKKVVCQYCRRHFVNVNHLNDHLQVHCGAKPYICIQLNCKASFLSNTELLVHRKTHISFKARCMFPNCGKIFNEAFKLYDHEAQHYKTFTCKFVDCGKVFHTQQQLDLHHKGHTTKKEREEVPVSDQNLQRLQSSPSVIAQRIPDPPPLKEADSSLVRCKAESVSVGRPETLESLLNVSQTPIKTVDRYDIKNEVKDEFSVSQTDHVVHSSVIQQTNLQPTDLHVKKEASYSQSPDHLKPSTQSQSQHVSPFEATINKMLREKTVLESQLQVFSGNVNSGLMDYSAVPVCSATRPTVPTVPQTKNIPATPMLQALPPEGATSSANQAENQTKPQTDTVLRERYHCAFETCTRNYSCFKSVSKHMKTSHPEFYAIRKIPRSEIKITYVSGPPLVPKPKVATSQDNQPRKTIQGAVRPKVIQSPPYTNMVTNYNAKLDPPVTVGLTASRLMENVLNPIVVAQLKNTLNPSSALQTEDQPILSPPPQKAHVLKCGTSKIHPPRPAESTTASLVPKGPACVISESNPTLTATDSIQESRIQSSSQSLYMPAPTNCVLPPSQRKTQEGCQPMWSAPPQNQQILSSTTPHIHPTRPVEATSASLPCKGQPSISTDLDPNRIVVDSLTKTNPQLFNRPTSTNAVLPPKSHSQILEENLPLWSHGPQIKQVPAGSPPQILPTRPVLPTSTPLPPKGHSCIVMRSDPNQIAVNTLPASSTPSSQSLYKPASANAALPLVKHSKTQETSQPTWSPTTQNKQMPTASPPQILSKRPVKTANAPLPLQGPSCIPGESNNIAVGAFPATSMQRSAQPLLPANIKMEEKCHVSSLLTLQRDSKESKNTNTMHHSSSQLQQDLATSNDNKEKLKPRRRSSKPRWPAIVRDGKFICSRCYREFNSSKSLGGHLSKRTACKPFDETELNTDLPASFLDLLNSEQTVSNPQPNHANNPLATYYNKPHTSKTHGSLEQKSHGSQKYQDNSPAYINGETSNDILKQIMTAANMADLFVMPQVSQFQKPCVSTSQSFQSTTVIRSLEEVRRDVGSCNPPLNPKSRLAGNRCPTPLLSQALKENTASARAITSPGPREIHSKLYHTDGQAADLTSLSPTVHPKSHPSPATKNAKQPERSSIEQDIKKKLREQILAGDFQRRSNLSNLANAYHNVESQSPMSCNSESSSKNEDSQISWDVKGYTVNGENPAIIPGTSAEIEALLNTQSFTCLRQSCTSEQDLQSPTSIALNEDRDSDPKQLSPSQQQGFDEIQIAFERLNLVREAPKPVADPVSLSTSLGSSNECSKVTSDSSQTLATPKVIFCEAENCAYSTISSEAFWRHLYKVHNYTFDEVNAAKKRYGQYAPFQCQKCNKSFTRNPNLRTHYISAHQLSYEEIRELDLKRRKDRAAMTRLIQIQSAGSRRKSEPASVVQPLLQNVNQTLLHQKPTTPVCTSVIQALPTANLHCPVLKQTEQGRVSTAEHGNGGHQRNAASGQYAHLPQTEVSPHLAKGPLTPGKQANRPTVVKPSNGQDKKTDKKTKSSEASSQYRPYRCVHQDCEAAFTIQHNLILHYRAVHQSALSALEVNKEQDQNETDEVMEQEEEEEELHISEFRCQVKDCSRVFQQVPHLMQHYLRLHEFSIDRVGDLLSIISLGRFTCGHQGCTVSFTAFWKYVAHMKEFHKDVKLSKPESLYKCEIEGCDRAYATKSNMLRHLMKKHQDFYLLKQKHQPKSEDGVKQNSKTQYQLNKTSDGKENIESNKTSPPKDTNSKRTRKINNYWTKYEKPVLKSNVEASAMCTKSYPLQYPCMIKGCESVMNSEKSILKHYTVHGLSDKFLEQHRSHYIFCKKFPRQKNGSVRSDDSKSDHSSDSEPELTADTGTEQTQFEDSKPFLRKRTSPVIPVALLDGLSNDDSSDGSVVIKRKRGRPKRIIEKIVKRKKMSRPPKACESRDECFDSSAALGEEKGSEQPPPLAAFKPMGFEMSFLKFLEQSNKTQPTFTCDIPLVGPWVRLSQLSTKETCVRFSNRQNLKSLDKVKIVVDKTFLGVTDLMLKQLQDMQPMVLLGRK